MKGRDLSADVALVEENAAAGVQRGENPCLIMLSGLPGTGKSYLSGKLRERLPMTAVESDAVRAALFQRPDFSSRESEWVFDVCHRAIEGLLRAGTSVVMDATNLRERHREPVYEIAERRGVPLVIVRVEAPPGVVRRRLEERAVTAGPGASNLADWEIYRRMRYARERVARSHLNVDTSNGVDEALDRIVSAVEGRLRG